MPTETLDLSSPVRSDRVRRLSSRTSAFSLDSVGSGEGKTSDVHKEAVSTTLSETPKRTRFTQGESESNNNGENSGIERLDRNVNNTSRSLSSLPLTTTVYGAASNERVISNDGEVVMVDTDKDSYGSTLIDFGSVSKAYIPLTQRPLRPIAMFVPSCTILPDGLGDSRQQKFVYETISEHWSALQSVEQSIRMSSKTDSSILDVNQSISMSTRSTIDFPPILPQGAIENDIDFQKRFKLFASATEMIALHRASGFGRYRGSLDSSFYSNFPLLPLLDDGLAIGGGSSVNVTDFNLKMLARREALEYSLPLYGNKISPLSSTTLNPHQMFNLGLRLLPQSFGEPVDKYVGRNSVIMDPTVGRHGTSEGGGTSVASTIGSASIHGAASASLYSEKLTLSKQLQLLSKDSSFSSSSVELPLLRVVRPLAGDALELALGNSVPALLSVSVDGVHFRDHPLFSKEDYLASGLKSLFGEYVRRMRSGAALTASLDSRLRSLLSYKIMLLSQQRDETRANEDIALSSIVNKGGAEDVVKRVYDFESDSQLSQLSARTGAVLESLSARYAEVTACSQLMKKIWNLWMQIQAERTLTGQTRTHVHMEATELAIGIAGVEPPPLYDSLLSTADLLDELKRLAQSSRADGLEGDTFVASRLVVEGTRLLEMIRSGEYQEGLGSGCGGVGSGVCKVLNLVENAEKNNVSASSAVSGVSTGLSTSSSSSLSNARVPFPGAREFVLELTTESAITPYSQTDLNERKRRDRIDSTHILVEILVNGRTVASSSPARLSFPEFTAECQIAAVVKLHRRPASVAVRVLDASSHFRFLIGTPVLSEVFVPVPGSRKASGKGENTVLPTMSLEHTAGVYEFASSTPMDRPFFSSDTMSVGNTSSADVTSDVTSALAKAVATAATLNSGDSLSQTNNSANNGIFTPLSRSNRRLMCGAVGVSAAWQISDTGNINNNTSNPTQTTAPVVSIQALPNSEAITQSTGVSSSSSSSTSATVSASASTLISFLGAVTGGLSSGDGRNAGRDVSSSFGPVTVGAPSSSKNVFNGVGNETNSNTDRSIFGLSTLPVPKATSSGVFETKFGSTNTSGISSPSSGPFSLSPPSTSTGGFLMQSALPGSVLSGSPQSPTPTDMSRTLALDSRVATDSTTARKQMGASLPIISTPRRLHASQAVLDGSSPSALASSLGLNQSSTGMMRRSQVLAQTELALAKTKRVVSSTSINVVGIDPNDPRVSAMTRSAAAVSSTAPSQRRSTRFRVSLLQQTLQLSDAVSSFGSTTGLSVSSSMTPVAGQQRLQLLRLRGERPDLFRELVEGVPIQDEDIARSPALLELLRTALISLGVSSSDLDEAYGEKGLSAFMKEGAKMLGMSVKSGSNAEDWLVSGGSNTAASAARARLLNRVREFLKRVRSSAAHQNGAKQRGSFGYTGAQLAAVVKMVSSPSLRTLYLNFSSAQAMLLPLRKLRPLAVDLGAPIEFAQTQKSGSTASSSSGVGSALVRGLSSKFRIVVQVVRARNVPTRRFIDEKSTKSSIITNDSILGQTKDEKLSLVATNSSSGVGRESSFSSVSQHQGEAGDSVVAVVEARFQGKASRTSGCAGSNPHWNEMLTLPFEPPGGDATPARLAEITESITLSLYDEVSTESRGDDRDRSTSVVKRHLRWIGSVNVPFLHLYTQGGFQAELKLDVPLVNLGYKNPNVVHIGHSTPQHLGGSTRVEVGAGSRGIALGGNSTVGLNSSLPTNQGVGDLSGVGLLATADANRRSTHVFVHIAVDPPLPSPSDDENVGEDDTDAQLMSLVDVETPAWCTDTMAKLYRSSSGTAEHAVIAMGLQPAASAISSSTKRAGGLCTFACGVLEHSGPCGAAFSNALGPVRSSQRDGNKSAGGLFGSGGGGPRMKELQTLSFDGPTHAKALLEQAARWSDRYSNLKESSTSAVAVIGRKHRLGRIVRAVASSINGEAVLVTRYLTPMPPPPDPAAAVASSLQADAQALKAEGESIKNARRKHSNPSIGVDEDSSLSSVHTATNTRTMAQVSLSVARMTTPDSVARFVQLVPFLADNHAFGSSSVSADLWATSQEFLDMGAGDSEEHAILLHNYLLFLEEQKGGAVTKMTRGNSNSESQGGLLGGVSGWNSFICIGRSQPEGEATWVLRINNETRPSTVLLINASKCASYYATDDSCPLVSIGMVASQYNMWANIQPFTEPWRMNFNFDDPTAWAPFFTSSRGDYSGTSGGRPHPGSAILPPCQSPLIYRTPDVKLASALEVEITGAINSALRSWRPRYVTHVRGDVSSSLKAMLYELELKASGTSNQERAIIPSSEGLIQLSQGIVSNLTVGPSGQMSVVSSDKTRTTTASEANGPASLFGLSRPGGNNGASVDLTIEHQRRLEQLVSRYRAVGCPLNFTFTDLEVIVSGVRSIGLHKIEDETVQFAISVAVIPYPNEIFSVWVYLVALIPK
jgi:hypothetical protein